MHLEFATERTRARYQVLVVMQKTGAKGDKLGDYQNKDIPKFVKEIQDTKTRLSAAIKANNAALVQAGQFLKLIKALDHQVGALAKDKPDRDEWRRDSFADAYPQKAAGR
jgi:hypothetical protein